MKFRVPALAIAAVCFAGMFPTSRASGPQDAPAPRRIEVTVKRYEFSPNEITVKKGEPVLFVITSLDAEHAVKIADLDVMVEVKKGPPVEVPFTATKAGDFSGQCAHFCGEGHGQMRMTLHVTE